MFKPRHLLFWLLIAGTVCVFHYLSGAHPTLAQTNPTPDATERERGIVLYGQGKIVEAIGNLKTAVKKYKQDYEAWHFLGLAQIKINDITGASRSLKNALALKPDFAPAHVGLGYVFLMSNKPLDGIREAKLALDLDPGIPEAHYVIGVAQFRLGTKDEAIKQAEAVLELDSEFAAAYLLKSQALVSVSGNPLISDQEKASEERRDRYRQAAAALEKYLQLEPNAEQKETWLGQIASLRFYSVSHSEGAGTERIYSSKEVSTKSRIIEYPEPRFPAIARRFGGGLVVLRCIFAADGTVKHLLIVEGQPHGITEAALQSARRIKFVPATLNGQPVSIYMQLEYDFNP